MITIKKVIAVLNLPNAIGDTIIKAKAISKDMTGNANFPTPSPTLLSFNTHIATLETAESVAKTKAIGTVDARDVALSVVVADMKALMAYVQGVANANIATAESVIKGAGFDVKHDASVNKQDFDVLNGEVSGTVALVAKGRDSRSAHIWEMSNDGTTWIALPPTLMAKTEVTGLTQGSTVWFRHRALLKSGLTDWDNSISLVIL